MPSHLYAADLIYLDGKFQPGLALLAGEDGRIEAILDAAQAGIQPVTRLRNRAILPGFVNAHSHTFQRLIRGRTESRTASGDDFWTWREAMYRAALAVDEDDVYHVARMAFLEMVVAGTTAVGEFHYLHRRPDGSAYSDPNLLARRIIAAAESVGLRIALLRSAYMRAGYFQPPHPGQRRFYETEEEYLANTEAMLWGRSATSWLGVAPHSIRAVPLASLERIVHWAQEHELPIHMHAAEQTGELDACRGEYGTTPVDLLNRNGLLSNKLTLVHAIHTKPHEVAALARAGSLICACPTTERNLGDGILDAELAAASNVRIAFGSDSQAEIDPLQDARSLDYHLRLQKRKRVLLDSIHETPLATRLFNYATQGGAEALGFDGGVLAPGRPADFFTVDLDDVSIAGNSAEALLPLIVFGLERSAIRDVVVAGRHMLKDGRHELGEEIVEHYKEVSGKVWSNDRAG
jgi:formimidoylglutamate deiminase